MFERGWCYVDAESKIVPVVICNDKETLLRQVNI